MARDEVFVPEHKTNILPLRWLANYPFHYASILFMRISVKKNHKYTYYWEKYSMLDAVIEAVCWKLYWILDIPYTKWGTYYVFKSPVLDEIKKDTLGWNDYDQYGIPYWNYMWSNDETTGDGWRLVLNEQ